MPDSLFGSDSEEEPQEIPSPERVSLGSQVNSRNHLPYELESLDPDSHVTVASYDSPPIPGFYLFPDVIPSSLQHSLTLSLSESIWPSDSNQVMLFDSPTRSSLPEFLSPLLDLLPSILSTLPRSLQAIMFDDTKARQCILNLYHPGQGITPHVDLPSRYEDGIIGISLLSSTVMDFTPVSAVACLDNNPDPNARDDVEESLFSPCQSYAVRLKPGSVYVLSGSARYDFNHGISYREEDVVIDRDGTRSRLRRGTRMSITLRRMRDGAEIIGPT